MDGWKLRGQRWKRERERCKYANNNKKGEEMMMRNKNNKCTCNLITIFLLPHDSLLRTMPWHSGLHIHIHFLFSTSHYIIIINACGFKRGWEEDKKVVYFLFFAKLTSAGLVQTVYYAYNIIFKIHLFSSIFIFIHY